MTTEQYLTVKEVAGLKGCSERNVQMLIKRGVIAAEAHGPESGGGGNLGFHYRVPLSALDSRLIIKFERQRRLRRDSQPEPTPEPLDGLSLSSAERAEISRWKTLLSEWRAYRDSHGGSKEEADGDFIRAHNTNHPDWTITRPILYRRRKALGERGDAGLLDRRGGCRPHPRKITPLMWEIFLACYLDESQKSVSLCVTEVRRWLIHETNNGAIPEPPELPSVDTFERKAKEIPLPAVMFFRKGEKAYMDQCSPYIRRMYDMAPNDIWVGDNHTFDVMLLGKNDRPCRVCLTVWMDVRTRKIMGWCVTPNPCGDATIYALKMGCEAHGAPNSLYTDNGREFTVHDFGGNGFRHKRPKTAGEPDQPTILKELGIGFTTALPRNARAKGVERTFRTLKEWFSKLFEAYTGGSVAEKPGKLKSVVKDPAKLKTVEEFTKFVDLWIRGIYNKSPHRGEGMRGMTPDEAFAALLHEKRIIPPDKLELMFMRWSNPLTVGKNGVTLDFYGEKLDFCTDDLWFNHFGKKVFIRYAPDDMTSVRVYDAEGRFICVAPLKKKLPYFAGKDDVREKQRENRRALKIVKAYRDLDAAKHMDELRMMADEAERNLAERPDTPNPKVIKPIFTGEVYAKAVGSELEPDDDAEQWIAALEKVRRLRGLDDDD